MGTFDVDTRLIGDDKARHQRLFLAVADSAAETAGSLMDVHQIPYTVSGAMVKVFTPFPRGHSCQHVQVVTRSSFQEHGTCQVHVALENGGKVFLHFLSQVAESKGTGDICGAFDISAAGVGQEKTISHNRDIGLRSSSVMYDSSVLAGSADGLKALPQVAFLLLAELFQFFRCADLGDRRLCLSYIFLQPVHKSGDSHAVFYVCADDVLKFHIIFCCFHDHRGVHLVDDLCGFRQIVVKRIIQACGIYQDGSISGKCLDVLIDSIVRMQRNLILCQLFLHLIGQLALIDVKLHVVHSDDSIGQKQREEFNIISTQVCNPADVIQSRDHMDVGASFLHSLPYS